jgi:hypothetical protein
LQKRVLLLMPASTFDLDDDGGEEMIRCMITALPPRAERGVGMVTIVEKHERVEGKLREAAVSYDLAKAGALRQKVAKEAEVAKKAAPAAAPAAARAAAAAPAAAEEEADDESGSDAAYVEEEEDKASVCARRSLPV